VSRRIARICALAGLFLAVAARPAAAQTPAVPPATPVLAGWQDGFFLQSADGNNRLNVGSIIQTDGRFAFGDTAPIVDTFTIKKARIVMTGRVAKYFEFRLMPDFGNGGLVLFDAYLDLRLSNKLRIRTGKDKTPVGYELLLSDPALRFPERSLPSGLVPNRDIGIQAQGDLAGGKVFYAGGVFNGVPDGVTTTTELDTNAGKDLAGRVVIQPFRSASAPAGAQNGLGFQLGGSTGREAGALPTFKTSIGQAYFSYAAGVTAAGRHNRVAPAVFYYHGRLGAFGEYIRSTQAVAKGAVAQTVANQGWDVNVSYSLSGEAESDRLLRPARSFDPQAHTWGAFELIARYAELHIDRAAFDAQVALAGASRTAQAWAVGADWYANPFIKYYVVVERAVFDHDPHGARPAEDSAIVRVQMAF
jgi:phosphate-selective porin OprO/OprP